MHGDIQINNELDEMILQVHPEEGGVLQECDMLQMLMGEASFKNEAFYCQFAFPRLSMMSRYTAYLSMKKAFEKGALRRSNFTNREPDGKEPVS